jgi:hypothetical protein
MCSSIHVKQYCNSAQLSLGWRGALTSFIKSTSSQNNSFAFLPPLPPPLSALTPRMGARPSVTPPNQVWVGGAQAPVRQLLLMRSKLFLNFSH